MRVCIYVCRGDTHTRVARPTLKIPRDFTAGGAVGSAQFRAADSVSVLRERERERKSRAEVPVSMCTVR